MDFTVKGQSSVLTQKRRSNRLGFMARKLRVEYAGAIYHVMNRGDRREAIFRDDADRVMFLETLGQACLKTDWQVQVADTAGDMMAGAAVLAGVGMAAPPTAPVLEPMAGIMGAVGGLLYLCHEYL